MKWTARGVIIAVVGATLPSLTVVAPAAAADGCAGASTALASLCVKSSTNGPTDAPYITTIHTGDRITDFKWLLNEDDSTGDPAFTADNVQACLPSRAAVDGATAASNPALAIYQNAGTRPLTDCPWPSVHASSGHSTVIASGDQHDVAKLANVGALGDHKYLISVTAKDFKIDGVHFEVRAGAVYSVNEEVGKPFVVTMNPLPKKTATVRVHVYNDNASTNGQWDGQTETLVTCADATAEQVAANCGGSTDPNLVGDPTTDMAGFSIQITDVLAATTTDVYGNPLCTQYETDAAGNVLLNEDGTPNPIVFADGGASGGALAGTDSTCLSDHYGDIVIPNMGPNRYAATVIPPDPRTHNGDTWIQTTTLEGGHDWDTWNIEGGTGYDTELIVGGERVPPVAHGFVKLTHPDQVWRDAETAGKNSAAEKAYYNASSGFTGGTPGTGTLSGTIAIGRAYIGSGGNTALAGTNLTNAKKDGVIEDGVVSVSCLATCSAPTDTTVWTGRARADGTFDVNGLQTGDYSVAFWDETQSYIMAVLQYSVVSGAPTNVGDILLSGWFTDLQGTVFNDLNGDGVHDPNEPGIPDFVLTERTRGNSLQDQGAAVAVTNDEGEYDLSQGYPLGQFLIAEAYNPRYKNTGFTYTTDNDPTPHTVHSAQVDVDFLPVIGLSAKLDWGVQAYGTGDDYWSGAGAAPKNENGGIVGTVSYDVTRNEFDPAFSVQEDYQPGIAGISMQLWKTNKTNGVLDKTATGAVQQYGISRTTGARCTRPDNLRGSNAVTAAGQDCKPYDYYVTESWQRPVGCMALDVNGNHLGGEMALPDAPTTVDYSHNPDAEGLDAAQSADCVEAPMSGFQIGGNGTVDGNYALTSLIKPSTIKAAPAGGAGLEQVYADSQNNPANSDPLSSDDYVVEAVNPVDTVTSEPSNDPTMGGYVPDGGSTQKRLYRFTDEKSINVMSGDTYVPQDGYSYTGDPGGDDYHLPATTSKIRVDHNSLGAGTVAKCAGGTQVVPLNNAAALGAINPDFNAAGGNPYAGQTVPVCDAKLVTVSGGRSMNPGFFMYTDVPIPSKFYGLVNDDLNVNVDRRSILLGEVAPASNVPVSVYDENGNWKLTAHSDVNGFYEILLPSMDTYNCPLPAGPCPNMYRLVGNDPGTLAHRNLDYNPQFRTIATEFQAWTGVVHPVDQAPTHNGITIEGPAAQFGALSLCTLAANNPVLYAIDKPYYDPAAAASGGDVGHVYTIKGSGFGASPGALTLGSNNVPTASWSDTQITFTLPPSLTAQTAATPGPYQLTITSGVSGLSTVNGLTFHRLSPASGTGSNVYLKKSDVFEVTPSIDSDNPGARQYTPVHDPWDIVTNTPVGFFGTDAKGLSVGNPANTSANAPNGRAIQRAVQAAYNASVNGLLDKLVVIYPNTAANYAPHNPNAAYFENVVLHGKVRLQGVGPGGAATSTSPVYGTNIDASQFWSATQIVPPGANQDTADGSYSDDWRTFASSIPRAGSGPADLPEGEAVLALAQSTVQVGALGSFRPGVDGILLTGGDQQGNPGNINTTPGAAGNGSTAPTPPGPAQGGAVMTDQYVRDFDITNNQIQSNGGTYGTLRIGTPDLPGNVDESSNNNDGLVVANNRIVANAGTNLAGALGLFAGANNYRVTGNDFCGNFSSEYGGAISHYGRSNNGTISRNRIYYNQGYDEGGGIMIAGALPANNNALSPGAGAVTIDGNTLISNQSNDDGGGIRFLMAGNFPMLVQNNIIANNLSTHEGGGIALDDSPNVTLVNNTVVKNITTATAATNGANDAGIKRANPAGLSTAGNSALFQACSVPTRTLTRGRTTNGSTTFQLQTGAPNSSNFGPLDVGATLVAPGVQAGAYIVSVAGNGRSVVLSASATATSAATASPGLTFSVYRNCGGQAPQAAGAPAYSIPKLFNNIFADNRAGWATVPSATQFNENAIHGIGAPGDSGPIQRWDMGVVDGPDGLLAPTNSVLNTSSTLVNANAAGGVAASPTNKVILGDTDGASPAGGIGFVKPQDFLVDSLGWRVNTQTSFPVIVAQMVPVNLLADYHLQSNASIAFNAGAASKSGGFPSVVTNAPSTDIDRDPRPAGGAFDIGADELSAKVDFAIVKTTTTPTIASTPAPVTYRLVVTNNGPGSGDVTVTDALPTGITSTATSWTCTVTGGAICSGAIPAGNLGKTVTVPVGGSVTFNFTGTVTSDATPGAVRNTASVAPAAGSGLTDTNATNDSSFADITVPPPAKPALTVLDNFNRANANNLGSNWSQIVLLTFGAIRPNANQASSAGLLTGSAYWNGASNVFGAKQGAAMTFANTSLTNDALELKVSGGSATVPVNFIRVRYTGSAVVVETTTTLGVVYTTQGSFAASFANGDTMTAVANADGSVDVWKTTAANVTTYLGRSSPTPSFTGTGRIGMELPVGARIDNFAGGTVP